MSQLLDGLRTIHALLLVLSGELDVAALLAERDRKLYVTLEEWCEAAMENQGRSLDRESLNRVLAKRPLPQPLPKEDP